jgi:hypothetical protein
VAAVTVYRQLLQQLWISCTSSLGQAVLVVPAVGEIYRDIGIIGDIEAKMEIL